GRSGAEVRTAAVASDVITSIEEWKPSIFIGDIGMPGEDGYSLIRRIRALGPDAGGDVPAIALTAYVKAEDQRQALGAGYDSHLAKPVDSSELIGRVAKLCGRA